MLEEMRVAVFSDFVSVDEQDLKRTLGLEIDDDGNFYDPLSKDLDNDGIADRYDNDFRDSDYLESTYDIDSLHKDDKPSILGQIKAYQDENKEEERNDNKESVLER